MGKLFSQVGIGWLKRRALEWGGLGATIVLPIIYVFTSMSEAQQTLLWNLLQGKTDVVSVSAAIGMVAWVWSQFRSYKATVKPQMVDEQGNKASLPEVLAKVPPHTETLVREKIETTVERDKAEKPSLLDRLKSAFRR